MSFEEFSSHFGFSLLVFLVLPLARVPRRWRGVLLLFIGALSFLSIDNLPLAAYFRSYIGELASTTLLLLGYFALERGCDKQYLSARHKTQLLLYFAIMGLMLFPAALGLSIVDPYNFGFFPRVLLCVTFVLCAVFWWVRNYFMLLLLMTTTLAYVFHAQTSGNYWDYLIDPILWFYCCGSLAIRFYPACVKSIQLLLRKDPVIFDSVQFRN